MLCHAGREFRCSFPSVRKAILRMPPRPMLFIHGEKDSYLPVEQSRLLYALAPQPKAFWIAPGARHNQAAVRHPELYSRLTIAFFDQHLCRAPLPSQTGIEPQRQSVPVSMRPQIT
jgi:pimeloyl-ACP methyl ester carboxylesterase